MKEGIAFSCISFFKQGKCPRAHTCNCPFMIKGVDYSKECIYSKVKLVFRDKKAPSESGEGSVIN